MGAASEAQEELFGLPVLTVSRLNEQVRYCLEENFTAVAVTGEIADLARPRSGHVYFTLRDKRAQISAVLWRGLAQRLGFPLADGMEVVVLGRVSLYGPRGTYQIIVSELLPRGIGEIKRALEELRRRLAQEGLFAEERKKALPFLPWTLAVITSSTGAAVMDIIRTAVRRFPPVRIRVIPVSVQGKEAPVEIVEALRIANLPGAADVILLGRGGGGIEDLWAFNTEEVVRAVAASRIPVVSCVGHERDITLTDLAADRRASTPTQAAELVLPVFSDIIERLNVLGSRALRAALSRLQHFEAELKLLGARPGLSAMPGRVAELRQLLDELASRLESGVGRTVESAARRLELAWTRLGDLQPLGPLRRGFSITRGPDGSIIRSVEALKHGDVVSIQFADGRCSAEVKDIIKEELAAFERDVEPQEDGRET